MIDFGIKALQNLVPNCKIYWVGTEWEGLQWEDSRPKPTKEQWEIEKARLIAYQPLQDCKNKAKSLLSKTDWASLPDVQAQLTNASEFISYRSQLRELIINPVEAPVFPTEPEARWK